MIYLIDDKTNRQQDFGWDENKIGSFKDILISISRYDQIEDIEQRKLMFSDKNIILFHESFFDNVENKHNKDASEIRNNLVKFAEKNKNFKVVFFSGSYNSREINETGGSIPVYILYQNMDCFLSNYKENGLIELKFLFFGKNPEIENVLIEKRENSNSLLIEELSNGKIDSINNNFIVSGNGQGFLIPLTKSTNQTIFNKNVNDDKLNIKLYEWFSEHEYNNLFIPLCFGPTLSDYNGLRLATHIRCSKTTNQLKPIFIYSFVDYSFLIENEYFDILKTKNVFLIECSKSAFQVALDMNISPLTIEENPKQIRKINLNVPKDIGDNHSIANQWAIYRWSQAINANDENIAKIIDVHNSNLYFKYLKTIYPISDLNKLDPKHLKINYSDHPKVLYIDDEAEKGWYEIFCKILDDENKLFFRHLDDEFNEKSKEEIIDISLKKIVEEDIDLVILDFRLHKDDFESRNIEEVTGYQILKKIKEYNKGIQVVIFSATNKIWNLQALQEAGTDGFIVKEAPENSVDPEFTKQSINNLKNSLELCINKIFLKKIYSVLTPLIEKVEKNKNKKQNNYNLKIQQGKLLNYLDYLKSADFLLYSNPNNLKYPFLQFILIIEDIIKNFYINSTDENHYVEISITEKILCLEKRSNHIILKLNPIQKWNKFSVQDYFIEDPEEFKMFYVQSDRIPFNYRLNCVLHFKYNIDLEKSSKYSSLYRLRSSSVAHIGNSEVKKEDILNSIELLNILIN